jgi:inner membrane protein
MCAAAHASHLLLDWLGADPSLPFGIQALWPFSHRWFISGWNLFPSTERRHMFSAAAMVINLEAAAWEIAIMGPIVLALGLWRRRGTGLAPNTTRTETRGSRT